MKKQLRILISCLGLLMMVSSCEKEDLLDAHFTASQAVGSLKVTFTNTTVATKSTRLDEIKSLWSFGDATTSTVRSPEKTYAAAGTYTVTLTVTDNENRSSVVTGVVKVPQ
jgi:PKD repeat protein